MTRLSQRTRYLNAVNTLKELLSMGVVPIVNENDTVSVSVGTDLFCSLNSLHSCTRKSNLVTMTPFRPSLLP
jgi:hypothetical protein